MRNQPSPPKVSTGAVPAEVYTSEYFLSEACGWREYQESGGLALQPRQGEIFETLKLEAGQKFLDIGCGRGEILLKAISMGAMALGIDYSAAAVALARKTLDLTHKYQLSGRGLVLQANCKELPFADQTFERVLMADVAEHLYPQELSQCLSEVFRVLKPGGVLLIHTTPNRWYANFSYGVESFLYQFLHLKLRGLKPFFLNRDSWALPRNDYHRLMHVNEMSPWELRRALTTAGFQAQLFFLPLRSQGSKWRRCLRHILQARLPFCLLLNSEICAFGRK